MPRPVFDSIVLVAGLFAGASAPLAQDMQSLGDLRACRGENSEVMLSFSLEGSACVEVGEASVDGFFAI